MNLDLTGKRALVGGSSKGIGKAAAIELAALGANVILMARSRNLLETLLTKLPNNGRQQHRMLVADFAEPDKLQQLVADELEQHGPIHILINNTGGPPGGPVQNAGVEEFKDAFSKHLICNQLLAQLVLPGMIAAKYGRIINVISTSVKQPIPGLGVSNTIRGAVASWAKTLSLEVAAHGITVNNVLPGFTNTERLESLIEGKASKTGTSNQAVADDMRNSVPAGRFGEASETGAAIAFLASPAAAYINGINLPVDGGRTASL